MRVAFAFDHKSHAVLAIRSLFINSRRTQCAACILCFSELRRVIRIAFVQTVRLHDRIDVARLFVSNAFSSAAALHVRQQAAL